MQYLLDTHTLIWMVEGDSRLSDTAIEIIRKTDHRIVVSMVSFWEISIKRSLGKLKLSSPTSTIMKEVERQEIELLNIKESHLTKLEQLPFHHRDPFDRMLVAQSQAESLEILSKDPAFLNYDVSVSW